MTEPVPPVAAVHFDRLVKMVRYTLNGRQEDQHTAAAQRPDAHQNDRRLGPAWIDKPERPLQPEELQGSVDQSVLGIEQPHPQHRQDDPRDDRGDKKDGTKEPDPARRFADQHRQQQRAEDDQRRADAGIKKGVPDRCIKIVVLKEQLTVIPQPDELGDAQHIVLAEAVIEGHDHGIEAEDQETDDPGRDKKVAPERIFLQGFHAGHPAPCRGEVVSSSWAAALGVICAALNRKNPRSSFWH